MPEGDPELPDDGLPDEADDDEDDCSLADIWRSKKEDLGDDIQQR